MRIIAAIIICRNSHPDYPKDWIIVKQSDHDDHCGYIAAHWTSPQFWQPWNRRLLTIAVAMHDTGSANWEDYPIINDEGEPWTYWTIPADDHIELHRNGVHEACNVHPYVGLLVSMHVVGIHRDRLHIDPAPNCWHMPEVQAPRVNTFIEEQETLQKQLRVDIESKYGAPLRDEQLMNDFKMHEVIDIISTQFSAGGLTDREMVYVPAAGGRPIKLSLRRVGEWDFQLTPFPFDGDRFDCPCIARRVLKRVYRDNDDFREAWYAAPTIMLPYTCVR